MSMALQRISESTYSLAVGWLASKENYQWLEFGNRCGPLDAAALKIMMHRPAHELRVFTDDGGEFPMGIVALSNINRDFRTAMLWYVLGEKSRAGKGLTSRAVSKMLGVGFGELAMHAIQAWAVEANTASIRVLERNGFRFIGRCRECHYIAGEPHDRLLFDLLANEYKGLL
jgi:RimJ/RimL family protein N-acetyltransferase